VLAERVEELEIERQSSSWKELMIEVLDEGALPTNARKKRGYIQKQKLFGRVFSSMISMARKQAENKLKTSRKQTAENK
jgi:hypothetical protein